MKKRTIESILDEIGIQPSIDGYKYLIDSCLIYDKNRNISVTELYEKVGDKYNQKWTNIERPLRYLRSLYSKQIQKYFRFKFMPTNIDFIIHLHKKALRREERTA